jgi:hypothetical protein
MDKEKKRGKKRERKKGPTGDRTYQVNCGTK